MRIVPVVAFAFGVLGALGVSCSSSGVREGFAEPLVPTLPADGGPNLSLGDASISATVEVTFKGTVYAPNGVLPLSNTLVYITAEAPANIPAGSLL